MLYEIMALVLTLIGMLLLFFALKGLFRKGWLLGWLKGMFNIAFILLAIGLGLIAWDVISYDELLDEMSVATISFDQIEEQRYQAVLVSSKGTSHSFELKGDQWQLDARIFRWSPALAKLGFKPGYRLERLSGRYYSLEKERTAERTVYDLAGTQSDVDLWLWFKKIDSNIPWLDALYGSATFVPMSDGALYEINLSHSGLTSAPLNERAQEAVNQWQ